MRRGARAYAPGDRALCSALSMVKPWKRHGTPTLRSKAISSVPWCCTAHGRRPARGMPADRPPVVAECDLIADEVVDRADPLAHRQPAPSPFGGKPPRWRDVGCRAAAAAQQRRRCVGHDSITVAPDGDSRISNPEVTTRSSPPRRPISAGAYGALDRAQRRLDGSRPT